jgi:type VI secretion system protein ImpE
VEPGEEQRLDVGLTHPKAAPTFCAAPFFFRLDRPFGEHCRMGAEELVKLGNLDGALAALQSEVRARPADARLRIFLFQLLCVIGDWKRAITQLKVAAELDAQAVPMAQTYREAIICEIYREKVFSGEKDPLVFGEPQEWLALLVNALKVEAQGQIAQAAAFRERAFETAPAATGLLNEAPFDWIADADSRLGPVLEIVVNGRYFWMPFTAIAEIRAEPPTDLRDTVWTAVNLTLRNGGEIVGLVPTRYAGTVATGDDAARLSRRTDWRDLGNGGFAGIGQRLLASNEGDTALMDLRRLSVTGGGGDG